MGIFNKLKQADTVFKKVFVGGCLFVLALPLGYVVMKNTSKKAGSLKGDELSSAINPAPQRESEAMNNLQNQIQSMMQELASSTNATSTIEATSTSTIATSSDF